MFILNCACGNEVYCSNEESCTAWQCEACGAWLDMFGCPAEPPVQTMDSRMANCMAFDGL